MSARSVLRLLVAIGLLSGAISQVSAAGSFDFNVTVDSPATGTYAFVLFNTSAGPSPNLTSFSIADFYSLSGPIFESLPAGWSGSATLTSPCFYTVTLSINNAGASITPGHSLSGFLLGCTKPDDAGWFGQNVPYTGRFDDNSTEVNPLGFGLYSTVVVPEP